MNASKKKQIASFFRCIKFIQYFNIVSDTLYVVFDLKKVFLLERAEVMVV